MIVAFIAEIDWRATTEIPATEIVARIGTAAFAARGGRTSSNSGTGSPNFVCNGPSGQFPRPMISAAPSINSAATETPSSRPRRFRNAQVHT